MFSPDQVVATALRALDGHAPSAIVARINTLLSRLLSLLPRRVILMIGERSTR